MDSEGIKSDVLGVIIRKDSAGFDELGIWERVGVYTPHESGGGGRRDQCVFKCNYYEGDLDTYISENSGVVKGEIGDITYAYRERGWGNEIAFVGNGVILSVIVDNADESENVIGGMGINCIWPDYSASITLEDQSITGMGSMYYMTDAKNAQEVVDKYVEGAIEPNEFQTIEYSPIEGTAEIDLGICKFIGRGVVGKYDWSDEKEEDWLFYSNESTWSISVMYSEGNNYEDYISVIENLE